MFQRKRTTGRRRHTSERRRTQQFDHGFRRLRLEPMEGRLMLSAAGPDFATLNMSAAHLTLESTGPLIPLDKQSEGGFIIADFSPGAAGVDADGAVVGSVLFDSMSNVLGTRGILLTNGTNTFSFYDATGAIRPAVIVPNDGSLETVDTTTVDAVDQSPVPDEGGTIRIESILATIGSSDRASRREPMATPLVEKRVGGSTIPQTSMVESLSDEENTLTGEWARAVVFEMAGGEPEAVQSTTQHEHGKTGEVKTRFGRSFTSTESDQSHAPETSANDVAAGRDGLRQERDGDVRTHAMQESASPPRLDLVHDTSVRVSPASRSGTATATAIVAATPGTPADFATDSALEEAFEQLGEHEEAGAHWLADYSGRSLEAKPLLILLALERIAARNSRRSGPTVASSERPS